MNKKIMTVRELASYLNVHPMTIYKLAKSGNIPAFKVGGQWRFKRELIDEWVATKIAETSKTHLLAGMGERKDEISNV